MEERPPDPPDPYRPHDLPPPAAPPPAAPPPAPPPPPEWAPSYGGAPPPRPGGPDPIPWEQPGLDFFTRFYDTLRLLATAPRKAYERVAVTHALGRPLAFAILIGWPGVVAATLWDIAFRSQMEQWLPWMKEQSFERSPLFEIFFALAAPIWYPVWLFFVAAIQHLFLWMVGGARSGFAQTFRVLSYAQITALAGFVPFCGSVVVGVWYLVLLVIGFSAVHRIGVGRALMSLLLPLLLCCGCIAILFSMFGAAWLAGMKGGG